MRTELLKILRESDDYVSGQQLCDQFGVSRTAVWKAISQLREEGYDIEAVKNRGYRLNSGKMPDLLTASEIVSRLHTEQMGQNCIFLETVDSTNNYLKQLCSEGKAHPGDCVIANQQTSGRGRAGRQFASPKGTGIYLSYVLDGQSASAKELSEITAWVAVAMQEAIEEACRISCDIKWVNDLFYKGKKVCGILTEAVTDFESGNIEFVVVGIGLNLYLDQEKLPQKLRSIAGALYETKEDAERTDRNQLTAMIVNELRKETADLKLSPDYVTHNMIPGHQITITDGTSSRQAFALEICRDGRLKVREEDGQETILSFGEVSVTI